MCSPGRFGGYETATVTVHPDGRVTVAVGTTAQGQGHQTAFAKLAASVLTISPERVEVVEGDTDAVAYGAGTWSSRSARQAQPGCDVHQRGRRGSGRG
jgi:carbon-monoxide dehydrogenase large subunit